MRWLKFGLPLRFSRDTVQQRGLPVLTQSSPPPHLVAHYRDRVQAGRVRRNDSSINTKTMYLRDVGNRARFLFSGISGPQKVGGGEEVEARDRSLKAQYLNISNR